MTDHTLQKQMIQSGAALSGIAVALGALGAHQLREALDDTAMDAFQTGVRYQFYHAFAILIIGAMLRRVDPKYARPMFQLFIAGIIIFSGSLYVVATRQFTLGDEIRWIGGLTPIGGIFFLAGWAILTFKGYKFMDGSERSHHHTHHSKSSSRSKTEEQAD